MVSSARWDILPEGFWLVQVCFGKLQSGFLMSLSAVGPPGSPSIGAFSTIRTILRSSFLERPRPGRLAFSTMGLKLPDNIVYGGHRNIKVFGDGLVALRLSVLGSILCLTSSDNSLVFFLFSMFNGVHTVTQNSRMTPFLHSNWLNEWFFFILQAPATHHRWEFNSKVKENHLLEIYF